jgi:hypothetical protein
MANGQTGRGRGLWDWWEESESWFEIGEAVSLGVVRPAGDFASEGGFEIGVGSIESGVERAGRGLG